MANPLARRPWERGKQPDQEDAPRLVPMLVLGTLPPVWGPPQPVRAVRRRLAGREPRVSMRPAAIPPRRAILRRHGRAWGRRDPQDPHLTLLTQARETDARLRLEAARPPGGARHALLRDVAGEIQRRLKDDAPVRRLLTKAHDAAADALAAVDASRAS